MAKHYFRVRNFEEFQHYKNRQPPWIKIYRKLLMDYEYGQLPDVSKSHLVGVWLLASQHNNRLPFDENWIKKQIQASENVNLEILKDLQFIEIIKRKRGQPAPPESKHLGQSATPETETETEIDLETEKDIEAEIDVEGVRDAWNAMAATYPIISKVLSLSTDRRKHIKARLSDRYWIENWREALARVPNCKFLLGDNDRGWIANFDWFIRPSTVLKIMEGKYDDVQVSQLSDAAAEYLAERGKDGQS